MKTIQFFIFMLSVQAGFAQTIKSDKLYQFYKRFNEVEDSSCRSFVGGQYYNYLFVIPIFEESTNN